MDIIVTADGSNSIIHPTLGDLYHSDRGALGEALHVYIDAGLDYSIKQGQNKLSILEIGFGSGLNTWLTMNRTEDSGIAVDYHAIELYPIDMDTASALNYTTDERFAALHSSKWNESVEISINFDLTKHHCDLLDFNFSSFANCFDLVYFDAFAPDSQPELWSKEVFERVFSAMKQGGILTTYTAKGSVKQALRGAGFSVERLKGALGKRHMLRAVKK